MHTSENMEENTMSFADDIRKSYSENKSPIKESEPIDKVAKKIMAHVNSEISSKVKDKHACSIIRFLLIWITRL